MPDNVESPRWTAIVMAAGQGTRMVSKTPKVAHALAGRPVVRHVIDAARAADVADIVVVVGADDAASIVREACGEGVRFAVQAKPLGTGDAVAKARDAAGDATHILIMNGDVPLVLPDTLKRLMSALDDAPLAVLTADVAVEHYGYLELDAHAERITRIVETKDGGEIDRTAVVPINSGQYAARAEWLWEHLPRIGPAPSGERYLTELATFAHDEGQGAISVRTADAAEVRGINDRVQLAEAEASMRDRIRRTHMLAGVTMIDPATTYIDAGVEIGADTVIEPQTHVLGATTIGRDCVLGPGTHVRDSAIGDRCEVRYSMVEESTIEDGVDIGPYSHVRPKSYICEGVHIGNYAEIKGSRLGPGTKMGHFSYLGDAEVGEGVNIGAGTITANYDGTNKNRTIIEDGAFIGTDTMLVAPVRIGRGARTAAGSVVTRDVPDGMMAIGAPARLRAQGAAQSGAEDQEASDPGHR
jgi:bifunctional UDP-N-acetylglucosamine pyrophosphorylase/glucosamine-1-phosphate N-acetyltransferase